MNSFEIFHWCLHNAIYPAFRFVFIDISNGRILNKRGVQFISMYFIVSILSYANVFWFSFFVDSNVIEGFFGIFGVTATLQVFNKKKNLKNHM